MTKIEIGCGSAKREGFYGFDIKPDSHADCVLDVETEPWPLPDDSVEYVYSSHAIEHFRDPDGFSHFLQEIIRVCRHDARVEIWCPYGKSNDALLIRHRFRFTENQWMHITWMHDRFHLKDAPGYFLWEETHYNLTPGILDELAKVNITLDFALRFMFDICFEWGVFLTVKKDLPQAPGPQNPKRVFYDGSRGKPLAL